MSPGPPHIDGMMSQPPELEVLSGIGALPSRFRDQLRASRLHEFTGSFEVWATDATSFELGYSTHGIFRFFGKFPPPVARHLIQEYSSKGDMVLDPMCGSGTTGVEALLLDRPAVLSDVSPLAVLLSQVKTTYIPLSESLSAIDQVVRQAQDSNLLESVPGLPGIRNPDHWFLPETQISLARLKAAIDSVDVSSQTRNLLKIALAAIIRRVSRATTQQGRLFLDKDTAVENAVPVFEKRARNAATAAASLPRQSEIKVHTLSILDEPAVRNLLPSNGLVICHPPYFTGYRFSRVNSFELAWLGFDHTQVRKHEVREAFKSGDPAKVQGYVDDMNKALQSVAQVLHSGGILGLMIGDTVVRQQYLPVVASLLGTISASLYNVEKIAFRMPRYTESSWVASQRRTGKRVGVSLCDYVVILRRV